MIAFTNPGGIRTDIAKKDDGTVSYADVFASQPFRNQLVTLTLTGAQIKAMLEQQWRDPRSGRASCRSRRDSATAGTHASRPASMSMPPR